jgi:hypothetical protein
MAHAHLAGRWLQNGLGRPDDNDDATHMTRTPALVLDSLRPRCTLRVAVVGNRRFESDADRGLESDNAGATTIRAATSACIEVWRIVTAAVAEALNATLPGGGDDTAPTLRDFYQPGSARVTVLSSLAAGADQIGARTALELGDSTDVQISLQAVLPFGPEDYPGPASAPKPEFLSNEAAALRRLAEAADQVVRVDGVYGTLSARRQAYRTARDMLLENADLMLALYDPSAVGFGAGTLETVSRALVQGSPVLAILARDGEVRVAFYRTTADRPVDAATAWSHAEPVSGSGWRRAAAERVAQVLSLPSQLAESAESAAAESQRLEQLREEVQRLRLFFGDVPPHRLCGSRTLGLIFAAAWALVLRFAGWFGGGHVPADGTPAAPVSDRISNGPFAPAYARASALADVYMRTYRGAFTISFLFAGVAVSAAVMLLAVSLWYRGTPPTGAAIFLGGLKIAIILVLLLLERASHQARYQELATDFRYLGELLRPMQWLASAGTMLPAVELPAHVTTHDPRHGWTVWLARAISRATPIVVCRDNNKRTEAREVFLDTAAITSVAHRARSEWLQGQLAYHERNATRMHSLDHGLERLAKLLLWIVLASAIIAFLLKALPLPYEWREPARLATIILGALSAALPAFIAALAGIMFQSEARRLSRRSETMRGVLEAQVSQFAALIEAATQRPPDAPVYLGEVMQSLRIAGSLMVEETGDWKVLYQTHEVHAG